MDVPAITRNDRKETVNTEVLENHWSAQCKCTSIYTAGGAHTPVYVALAQRLPEEALFTLLRIPVP
jgi:hypothetical protein